MAPAQDPGFFRIWVKDKSYRTPRNFPERYFYNPDKFFKILPEVYDNSDKNHGFWKKSYPSNSDRSSWFSKVSLTIRIRFGLERTLTSVATCVQFWINFLYKYYYCTHFFFPFFICASSHFIWNGDTDSCRHWRPIWWCLWIWRYVKWIGNTQQSPRFPSLCWHYLSHPIDKTGICVGTDMLKFRLLFLHYK